jgi:hypothetical protein
MFGSAARVSPSSANPLRVLARLLLVSLAILSLARIVSVEAVALLLPVIKAEVTALDDNVSIFSLDLSQDGPSNTVRLRANLLRPIYIHNSVVYPLGFRPHTEGWYQVNLNTRGVLQSSLLLLIIVLSWPQRSMRDLPRRLAVALPFIAILIAIDAPLELLGNLHQVVLHDVDPQGFHAMFAWDKFLEGGGNCALALAFAALAIVLTAPEPRNAPSSTFEESLLETAENGL